MPLEQGLSSATYNIYSDRAHLLPPSHTHSGLPEVGVGVGREDSASKELGGAKPGRQPGALEPRDGRGGGGKGVLQEAS